MTHNEEMKVAGKSLEFAAAAPREQVAQYLEQLARALRVGSVHVRHGDSEVVLGPRDVLDFAVHAKARRKRHRLSLELTWHRKPRRPEEGLELGFVGVPSAPEVGEADGSAVDATTAEDERHEVPTESYDGGGSASSPVAEPSTG